MRRHGEGTQLVDRTFQIPAFAIDRPALLERLDEGIGGKVTALVAPPGFGKSLLLQQWIRARDHLPLAWLSLDERDDYGPRLAARLVGAFATIDVDIGRAALERVDATGKAMGDRFIAHLLSDLEMIGPVILVLDGIDSLSNRRLVQDLRALVEHSSTDFGVVLATRGDDGMQVRLGTEATWLGRADLAFTRDDTSLLMERLAGRALSDRQIDDLQARTEGWPAAIQLAALALRDDPDVDGFIDRLSGDDQFISGYLTEEVLARLPDDTVSFLVQTSILSSLSGPLCDAVTGRGDSAEMLDQLNRKSMFLVPTGDGQFRYHRLFRDLTRRELNRTEPEDERRLLRSAADWHLARREFDLAASYFIEAEEWEPVLHLATTHGRTMFELNEPAVVLGWIQSVPAHVRQERPTTRLEEVVLEGIVGHTVHAEELAGWLERSVSLTAGERIVLDVLRATWVQWHAAPRAVIAAADEALAALEHVTVDEVPDIVGLTSASSVRQVALASRARAYWYIGDGDRARSDLVDLADEGISFAPWVINTLGAIALIDAWSGRLHEAYQGALRALLVASRADLLGHHATVDAHLAMAEVLRERDSLARAELALEEAFGPMARVQRSASLAIHTAFGALLDLADGEPARGVDRIARFLSAGHGAPPPIVAARLGAVDTKLRLALGDSTAADRLLEGIEQMWTTDHASAVVQVMTSRNELEPARMLLASWPQHDLRSRLDRLIWTAIVEELDGDHGAARLGLRDAVALAEPQGHVRVFVEAGPDVHRLLRWLFDAEPTPYLRRLVDACDRSTTEAGPAHGGAGLSPRELLVLGYLPTRLSNAEIAEVLYVSLNTIKTHLRKIYQRLGVSGRRQAVEAAERLGLL